VLAGCGGRVHQAGSGDAQSICDFRGAADTELPLELTRFGSFAMGATSRGVYLAESLGEARLVRAPRTGGPFTVLGSNLFYVQIRTSGDDVYVISQGFAGGLSALYRLGPDDRLLTLDADLKGANDLVITPAHLYVADGYSKVLYRYDRNGRAKQQIATDIGTAHLVADGETLYYLANGEERIGLYRLESDLSSTLIRGDLLNSPERLFFLNGLLYGAGSGIHAYDLAALTDTPLASGQFHIDDIVRLGDTFYFTSGMFEGDFERVPVAGGTSEVLAQNLGYGGIATDGVSVFYDSGTSALAYCPTSEGTP